MLRKVRNSVLSSLNYRIVSGVCVVMLMLGYSVIVYYIMNLMIIDCVIVLLIMVVSSLLVDSGGWR